MQQSEVDNSMWMERRATVRLAVIFLTILASACAILPPQTATELAARLASGRTLFSAKETADVLGVTEFTQGVPTRIPGISLHTYYTFAAKTRTVILAFPDVCLTLAEMEWHFGKPGDSTVITDGGGVSYDWELNRWFGPRVFVSITLRPPSPCALDMSVTQTVR